MPVHDWSRADGDLFRAFVHPWLTRLCDALNGGVLPAGFYALQEPTPGRGDEPVPRRRVAVFDENARRVAVILFARPGDKDRPVSVTRFAGDVAAASTAGTHVLLVDLFSPGRHDPDGFHAVVEEAFGKSFAPDPARPLTLASYVADAPPVAHVRPLSVRDELPDMPLFLDPGHDVNVPLGPTYEENFAKFPRPVRAALEG